MLFIRKCKLLSSRCMDLLILSNHDKKSRIEFYCRKLYLTPPALLGELRHTDQGTEICFKIKEH